MASVFLPVLDSQLVPISLGRKADEVSSLAFSVNAAFVVLPRGRCPLAGRPRATTVAPLWAHTETLAAGEAGRAEREACARSQRKEAARLPACLPTQPASPAKQGERVPFVRAPRP